MQCSTLPGSAPPPPRPSHSGRMGHPGAPLLPSRARARRRPCGHSDPRPRSSLPIPAPATSCRLVGGPVTPPLPGPGSAYIARYSLSQPTTFLLTAERNPTSAKASAAFISGIENGRNSGAGFGGRCRSRGSLAGGIGARLGSVLGSLPLGRTVGMPIPYSSLQPRRSSTALLGRRHRSASRMPRSMARRARRFSAASETV